MITVQQAQIALDSLKAQNAFLRRQLARRKQHVPEYGYKNDERPMFRLPELDAVLEGTEAEAEELIKLYRLEPQAERTVDSLTRGLEPRVERAVDASRQGMTPQEVLDLILN